MDTMKRIGALVAIFMAGGITFVNITVMKYGIPAHYDAGYDKIGFAVFLAIMFGYFSIRQERK